MNDCVFYCDGGCHALNRENCIGCSFRKTKAELQEGRSKAFERISNLPRGERAHILNVYYKGSIKKAAAEWLG